MHDIFSSFPPATAHALCAHFNPVCDELSFEPGPQGLASERF